jgi:hypothetical protein
VRTADRVTVGFEGGVPAQQPVEHDLAFEAAEPDAEAVVRANAETQVRLGWSASRILLSACTARLR